MNITNKCSVALITLSLIITSCSDNQERKKVLQDGNAPNIILIVADDLGYADIGVAKLANDIVTPNIDRLAESGIRFTQAYDTSPICNQSRIGIITGS